MRVTTPYAPTTFLKPCLVVDTIFIPGGEQETAILFHKALNANHALAFASDSVARVEEITGEKRVSDWIVIKQHKTSASALKFHLQLTKTFMNGGTQKQWEKGMRTYNSLYNEYCPTELGDDVDPPKNSGSKSSKQTPNKPSEDSK